MFVKINQWEAINVDYATSIRLEFGENHTMDRIVIKSSTGIEFDIFKGRIFSNRTLEDVFHDLIGVKNAGT